MVDERMGDEEGQMANSGLPRVVSDGFCPEGLSTTVPRFVAVGRSQRGPSRAA